MGEPLSDETPTPRPSPGERACTPGALVKVDFKRGSLDLGALNVLIIPDKFKGTLDAASVADALARGWKKSRPLDQLTLLPMSDGGDGFGQVLGRLLSAEPREFQTQDAAHRPCAARWWWEGKTKTALIDSAGVIGLAMLPPKQFHPFDLDTYGLGLLLAGVAAAGADQCLIGIGGSATNEAGFGMARALGWKFLRKDGGLIHHWADLAQLEQVEAAHQTHLFKNCSVAVDVQNPLLGLQGATRIYGPQKGMRPQDFEIAERALGKLARLVREQTGQDVASLPGAGAAGGLGFGCGAFLGAKLEPGFDLFASLAQLEKHLEVTDVVLTGEGAIDQSTIMGKGVGRIARRCRELSIPCLAFAGQLELRAADACFASAWALTNVTPLEDAKARTGYWLEQLARTAAAQFERHDEHRHL